MSKRIRGILFDLGDTLLDFGKVDVSSLFEQGAHLAYQYLKKLNQPLPSFARYHRRQLWEIRWNYFKSRLTRREFNALDLIGRLGDQMGHDLTPEQVAELAWLWYEPLSRCATVEQGARDVLVEFSQQGMVLGLVSNTFVPAAVLDRHLEQENLLELLPVRVYSCDVRFRKPSSSIFAAALSEAHLEPRETIFVGDSPHADIEGAKRAGIISVLKDPLGRYDDSPVRPAHRIRSLLELPDVVAKYNGKADQAQAQPLS